MSIEEFYTDLSQSVAGRAAASSDFTESAFAEFVAEALADSGDIADFIPCHYRQPGVRIDGYSFASEEATLDLFIVEYFGGASPESLTRTVMDQCFRRVEAFFEGASVPGFSKSVEITHPVAGLGHQIADQAAAIVRVRVHLISDGLLSSRIKELPSKVVDGREWSYRVWDLQSIERALNSEQAEALEIDFQEMFGAGLPCLPANTGQSGAVSYLAVIPGRWLAEIYDRFGGRLLEQNVRTFLQVKGKVNKGIRTTILEEPAMFFAYNNGISATAAHAEFGEGSGIVDLRSVSNLQIVNGGQTTASIFNVLKKDKGANLDQIMVQMKLSIVKRELMDQMVPRISEYANSQNKVSAADFFSNHPFHVRIEGISRRMWAPSANGIPVQTHWFYERARGQYANAQAYLTPARQREYELQHPRKQLITKTELSKYTMTFRALPHVVSLGAQKNFGKFAEYIGDAWKEEGADFGDEWFRMLVAQTIIFRSLETLVQQADWYAQGYRAQIVTYSIALLQHQLGLSKQSIDYEKVWQNQRMSTNMGAVLLKIGEIVKDRLISASSRYGVSNVAEWCKRDRCWDDIKALGCDDYAAALDPELVSAEQEMSEKRGARRNQRVTNEVDAQTEVVTKGGPYWQAFLRWAEASTVMTPSEIAVIKIAAGLPHRIPTGPQSQKLIAARAKAIEDGFRP